MKGAAMNVAWRRLKRDEAISSRRVKKQRVAGGILKFGSKVYIMIFFETKLHIYTHTKFSTHPFTDYTGTSPRTPPKTNILCTTSARHKVPNTSSSLLAPSMAFTNGPIVDPISMPT